MRHDVCGDANPGVADPNCRLAILTPLDRHGGGAAFGGELHGILQHIADYLGKAGPVCIDPQPGAAGPQGKLDSGSCEQVAVVLDGTAYQFVEIQLFLLKLDLSPGDPRDVKQIVDQPGQVRDLALDHRFSALHLLGITADMREDVEAVLRCERVAQLVGEHREKLILPRVRVAKLSLALS